MRKILQRSERGMAFLLAFLMAVSSPASVLAANPIVTEVKDEGNDLDYTFTENTSEDGTSADIQLEVIEKNGNMLTEVTMPDGTVIFPEARDGQGGFKQSVDGAEKNIVHYEATENGTVKFKLKYRVPVGQPVEEETGSPPTEGETSEETGLTDIPETETPTEDASTEFQSEPVETETGEVYETEQNPESTEPEGSEQNTETTECQVDTESNLLGKVVDTIFPVMEVQAAEIESLPLEKEKEIEYQVTSLNENAMSIQNAKSGGEVTTFEELKAAIADANDGEIIRIEGIINVIEPLRIEKSITLSGGTLKNTIDASFISDDNGLIEVDGLETKVILENITLDGNDDGSISNSLVAIGGTDGSIETVGRTVLKNANSKLGSVFLISNFSTGEQTITINDGTEIVNNICSTGGLIGGWIPFTFIMNGGIIKDNISRDDTGMVAVLGAAYEQKMIMNGGIITDNRGGGINIRQGSTSIGGEPIDGGYLKINGDAKVINNQDNNGNTRNIFLDARNIRTGTPIIMLSNSFNGTFGISGRFLTSISNTYFQDVVINGGSDPIPEMTQDNIGSTATIFSDNPDYITRLEPDGDNHKVVLGFPKVTYHTKGGDFAPGEEQEFYTTANQPITKPSNPTFTDHAFIAWYTTPDYQDGTEYDFNTPITKDTDLYARWFPNVYFIDFDANGGTGTMDTIVQDGTESVNLPANVFTNGTYLFDGWNTAADGSGTAIADGETGYTPGKKDVTLYAQWKERTYTVKYDTGGGTPSTIADKDNIKFDESGLLPTDMIKKEGYTLTGWNVQGTDTKVENDTKYSDLVTDYTIPEVTLEAQWSENTYTVKYDTNGGMPTAITDKTNVKFKDTGLLPADDPTRPGYTFEGWEAASNQVLDTTAYKALVADDTVKSVTLVAQWEAKEYTVKYDSNGGIPVSIAEKGHVKFWDAELLPSDIMTKPGYTFGGWNYNTKPVSDTTKYSDLAADDTVREITLVAQWTPKQYTVHYDVNGGTPDNYPSEVVGFESVVPIPAVAPAKDGYDFKGWLKDTTKIDGTSVTYDSLVADDTVSEITLEAQWEEKSYTVKFELKPGERGGTLAGDTADQSVKYNQHAAAGAEVSVNAGSAFLGWNYSYIPAGAAIPISGTVMDYTTVPILNNVTFTANFAKVPFVSGISTNGSVSVQKGGAPADAGTDTITKIEYDLTDILPAKAGFKFEGVLHYHIDEIKFTDLYNHEFTLDLNNAGAQEFVVGEDGHTSKIQITVDKPNGTVDITGIEESLKFNFIFTEDTRYTVSFKEEADSADNWGQNTDLYTGDAMGKAPVTNPVKPGYAFDGWSSDGSNSPDKMYNPGALVTDKDEVYYAVWTPKEYTVHYNTDGGSTVPDKTGVHYTDTKLTPADNPTKPGYTFAGWEKDTVKITADTAYNTLVADDTVMEVTLTAKWEIKHFNASWVLKDSETLGSIEGGNQKEEGIAYKGNATEDVTAAPASNDSEFIGWEYSYIPDGATTPVTGFTEDYKTIPVLGDITFTAKFAAKPFVSIGAVNGKVTAAKGTTPEEISGSSGTSALVQYTAAEDIEHNKGKTALKYAADIHHHLTTISFKDMSGHEYTIWTKDGGGAAAGSDYEVGDKIPATLVKVEIDEQNGTILVSNIDTSLAFTVVFEEDPKYKVEFFRDKEDPASLVQTNDGLYTGNPVGDKPQEDPTKPGYHFLGWSSDGTNDPDKMYSPDARIADVDIAYYGVWELIDYKLAISNTVAGEYGNKKQDFHFTITLKDKDGKPLSGTYPYSGAAIAGVEKPGDGTVTLDVDGTAEITLKHGQSIILDGLHIGEQYTVMETEADQNGYITTSTGDTNLSITDHTAADFTNTRTIAPPTGVGPIKPHLPALILSILLLLLTCTGFLWARRKRRA